MRLDGNLTAPRSIASTKPFLTTAREYLEKGWGVLPLPERRKEFPPVGFTGRAGRFADEDDLRVWLNPNGPYQKGNIAIRVGNVVVVEGIRYEVIGIDVDAHSGKKGERELADLEKKLGELPDTWISSSRSDGVSGIRFYLVPHGFGFRGKASDSIDIVQRVHRYAVVYPSWHPDTKSQYYWYKPGFAPDGRNMVMEIPVAASLPILPEQWVNELTQGGQLDSDGYGIDLDISNEELKKWARTNFPPPIPEGAEGNCGGGMCKVMRRAVENHVKKILESNSNHDKITNAHWHLITLGAEGHSGWKAAVDEVEAVWLKDIKEKAKRPENLVKREITRSFWGTLRKVKAKADAFALLGFSFFSPELCIEIDDLPPVGGRDDDVHWVSRVPLETNGIDPREYDKNDVGMAQFFHDRVRDNVRWLGDYNGWMIYDGITWHIDDFNHVRDLFHRACVRPCKKAGLRALKKLLEHEARGGLKTDNVGRKLVSDSRKLLWIAEHYGNDSKIKAMLNCMKSIPGVGMKYSELNWDTTILAMPNGKCLRLTELTGQPVSNAGGFVVIDNEKRFFTTMSTAVELKQGKAIDAHERELWQGYLELFLPEVSYRRFVQKVLGYLLIGGNPEKLAIFLVGIRNTGKSTMLQAIQAAMGDYGETFQPNALFKDSGSGNNPELASLLHKRGVFSSESGSQRIFANPLKRNTGGDRISTMRKYSNHQIIGVPHFTPVVATNQPPTIDDADEALVKRIMVCPFDIQVSDSDNDKRADVVIPRDAKHAIFNWLVYGYQRYVREGLNYDGWPDKVKAATIEFANELSDISTFLAETCVVADDDVKHLLVSNEVNAELEDLRKVWGKVSADGLYMAYQNECAQSGQTPIAPRIFGKKVKQIFGVDSFPKRTKGGAVKRFYRGLKYKNESAMTQTDK